MDEFKSYEDRVLEITKLIQDIFNFVSDSTLLSNNNLISFLKNNALFKDQFFFLNISKPSELDLAINAILNIKLNNDGLIWECFSKQKQLSNNDFTYYDSSNRKICYMDYNMFVNLKDDSDFKKKLGIDDYVVPYSPAHIAEVFVNPKKDMYFKQDLNNISEKTGNVEILFNDAGSYQLVKEDVFSCFERTGDGSFDTVLATNQKLINEILFRLNHNEILNNRKVYNNRPESFFIDHKKEVNHILNLKGLSFDLDSIKLSGNCNDYEFNNDYIHNLYFILDYYGVKKDNKYQKICSSRFDIEHLLYASCATLFLTRDERLRIRAKAIFSALGKNVMCPKVSHTFNVMFE